MYKSGRNDNSTYVQIWYKKCTYVQIWFLCAGPEYIA